MWDWHNQLLFDGVIEVHMQWGAKILSGSSQNGKLTENILVTAWTRCCTQLHLYTSLIHGWTAAVKQCLFHGKMSCFIQGGKKKDYSQLVSGCDLFSFSTLLNGGRPEYVMGCRNTEEAGQRNTGPVCKTLDSYVRIFLWNQHQGITNHSSYSSFQFYHCCKESFLQ